MTRVIPLRGYRVTITDTGYQTHEHAPLNVWCEVTRTDNNNTIWSGYQHHDPARLNMLPAILETAFPPGMNGYPGLFVGDGFALCVDCGRASLRDPLSDDPGQFTIDWSYSDTLSGLSCDECSGWIYEPHCPECAKEESELETALLWNDSGDRCVCRQCVAEALLRTREREQQRTVIWRGAYQHNEPDDRHEHRTQAHLTAPGEYELTNCWYADTYRTPAASERHSREMIARFEEEERERERDAAERPYQVMRILSLGEGYTYYTTYRNPHGNPQSDLAIAIAGANTNAPAIVVDRRTGPHSYQWTTVYTTPEGV